MKNKNERIKETNKIFLGKKTKEPGINLKKKQIKNREDINKNSILLESSTEISSDNINNLDENIDIIPGFDDINIPSFFNDNIVCDDINKQIKNYYKIRKEFGSKELAELYLVDINRLYEEKKKI